MLIPTLPASAALEAFDKRVKAMSLAQLKATERAAWQVAEQMNRNLTERERQQGSYIVRIRPSGKGWKVRWLAY